MRPIQYVVRVNGIEAREKFIDYIDHKFNLGHGSYSKEHMINSKFPFVVDFKNNRLWVLESVTCCAHSAIIPEEKFIEMAEKD